MVVDVHDRMRRYDLSEIAPALRRCIYRDPTVYLLEMCRCDTVFETICLGQERQRFWKFIWYEVDDVFALFFQPFTESES